MKDEPKKPITEEGSMQKDQKLLYQEIHISPISNAVATLTHPLTILQYIGVKVIDAVIIFVVFQGLSRYLGK